MLRGFQVFVSGVALVAVTFAGASVAPRRTLGQRSRPHRRLRVLALEGDVALDHAF